MPPSSSLASSSYLCGTHRQSPSLPPSVHLSQDDEQVPGRHGAVAAAAAATAEDAVADDDDDDDSGWIRWPSDAGLEAFEATDLFQLCCEFGLGIYLPT